MKLLAVRVRVDATVELLDSYEAFYTRFDWDFFHNLIVLIVCKE